VNGDTVLVAAGTYHECLTIASKSISLSSLFLMTGDTTMISTTIIDADSVASAIVCINGGTGSILINGLTIEHGLANYGGGLYCTNSSIVLKKSVIKDNVAL